MSGNLQIYLAIAWIVGFLFVGCFLRAMFRREAVKRELLERGCKLLHVWWVPCHPVTFWPTCHWGTPFRVIYRDPDEHSHRAYCCVYAALNRTPFGTRRVDWIKDETIDFIDV